MFGKIGVLLVNLGTPDAPTRGAVYRYLKEFLLDPRVVDINAVARNILVRGIIAPFRSGKSAKLYKMVWTEEGSPLKVYGYELRDQVQEQLGDDFVVELAMRYQTPSIASAIEQLQEKRVREIIVLPLFPQYASATTGSVHDEVMRILRKEQIIPQVKFINSYYNHEKTIDAFIARAEEHDVESYDHVLFSYHGLPKRQLRKGDRGNHCQQSPDCCMSIGIENQHCYSAQCYATTKGIVKRLGLSEDEYTTCFQSRLGNDPWLEPYTSDILEQRYKAGDKRILVFCPAFVADCLETTVEISIEYAEEFEEMGGEHLELVEGLNSHPKWVEAVVDLVQAQVQQPMERMQTTDSVEKA